MSIKEKLYHWLIDFPLSRNIMYGVKIYPNYYRSNKIDRKIFLKKYFRDFYLEPYQVDSYKQLSHFIKKVSINPVKNDYFFYSIDCFKGIIRRNHVLENFTVDYERILRYSFADIEYECEENSIQKKHIQELLNGINSYIERCRNNKEIYSKYKKQIDAIEAMNYRSANSLFDALQRILFYNQLLWQSGHRHNGLGRLDVILYEYYMIDKANGISEEEIDIYIKNFWNVLHEYYWFKSGMALGDTGQLIVIGGLNEDGKYLCNELTEKLLKVSKDEMLPDPKLFLRCAQNMPENILRSALECISTGMGAPFLSNDEKVIPALIECGYGRKDSYDYVASACWEPLCIKDSCDLNNIKSLNYTVPFIRMLDEADVSKFRSIEDIVECYAGFLTKYISEQIMDLCSLVFEDDPLITIISSNALREQLDITKGGAKYNNLGLTSVGISSVIDSLLNIDSIVFEKRLYTLEYLNSARKENFHNDQELLSILKNASLRYGCDEEKVVSLTNSIIDITNREISKYSTHNGGVFKFGLSSPFYIEDARQCKATLDGRRDGEPFNVHISSRGAISNTELLSFAAKLQHYTHGINGNVVDFFETEKTLSDYVDKYLLLLKIGVQSGFFQLQMNVVDSKKLINARNNPELYPDLIVRVWGFSAYFNDLPEEYKELIIQRALLSESA